VVAVVYLLWRKLRRSLAGFSKDLFGDSE